MPRNVWRDINAKSVQVVTTSDEMAEIVAAMGAVHGISSFVPDWMAAEDSSDGSVFFLLNQEIQDLNFNNNKIWKKWEWLVKLYLLLIDC